MAGLPDGEKTLHYVYNRIDTIPACARRTNRHLATI